MRVNKGSTADIRVEGAWKAQMCPTKRSDHPPCCCSCFFSGRMCEMKHTVSPKSIPLDVWQYFWQMWTDFPNYFTNWFVRKFSMYTHKDFHITCNMLLHYVVKFENLKKVTKYSRWTWQLICLTKICCEILCNLPQKYCTNDFAWIRVYLTHPSIY